MTNDIERGKRTKRPELRTVVARRQSPLGALAALVLIRLFGHKHWFIPGRLAKINFVRPDRFQTDGRTDVVTVGEEGTFAAENDRTEADAVARHLDIHKMPSMRSVLAAIRRSVVSAQAETFADEPAAEIPATPVAESLRELRVIVTHKFAHLDELVAIAMILLWGNGRLFLWTELPQVIFAEDETAALKEYSKRPDAYFVGIGNTGRGRKALVSDEHRTTGRLADTCATDLVAKRLGLDKEPSLQWLFDQVRASDVEAGQEALGLGQLLKVVQNYGNYDEQSLAFWLEFVQNVVANFQRAGTSFKGSLDLGLTIEVTNRFSGHADESNLEVVRRVVDAFSKRAMDFNVHCPKEFEAAGSVVELPGGLRLAKVTSDRYVMSAWARNAKNAHIVVQGYSSGHVRVYSTNHDKHPMIEAVMERTARHLMAHEMRELGASEEAIAEAWGQFQETCESSNDLPGNVPWYYLHADNSALLNGSRSHERPATRLSLEGVADTVREAYDALQAEQAPAA